MVRHSAVQPTAAKRRFIATAALNHHRFSMLADKNRLSKSAFSRS
jgi:hypothetical protein